MPTADYRSGYYDSCTPHIPLALLAACGANHLKRLPPHKKLLLRLPREWLKWEAPHAASSASGMWGLNANYNQAAVAATEKTILILSKVQFALCVEYLL